MRSSIVTALSALILAVFSAVSANAQFSTSTQWEVVDAAKRVVGEVSSFDQLSREAVGVAYRQDAKPNWGTFLLLVHRDRIEADSELYFENKDCTGRMGIPGHAEKYILHPAAIAPPGKTVYIMDRHADAFRMVPQSIYTTKGKCRPIYGKVMVMMPVAPVLDVEEEFAPPYYIRQK